MIEFKRIEIENFGPYHGIHKVDFRKPNGVWIAYGANGRGKTSILNAFRYVLYGELKGRVGPLSAESMVNSVARRTGEASGFRISLEFSLGGYQEWEVVRTFDLTRIPGEVLRVSVDGSLLNQEAGREALESVAPPELSGFFLFDGEDLRRYELLLEHDGEVVEELRSAIERILGIPFLERVVSAAGAVKDEADKKIAEHLKKDEQTRQQGEALDQELKLKAHQSAELETTERHLSKIQSEIVQLEEELKKHRRATRVMERLEEARANREHSARNLEESRGELQSVTPDLWRLVLQGRLKERLEDLTTRKAELRDKDITAAYGHALLEQMNEREGQCPLCDSPLESQQAQRLKARLDIEGLTEAEKGEARELEATTSLILDVADGLSGDLILEKSKVWDKNRLELQQAESRVNSLNEELEALGAREEEVNALNRRRIQLGIQEEKTKEKIGDIKKKITDHDRTIEKLRSRSEGAGSTLNPQVKALSEVAEDVRRLFNRTADVYREQMRQSVEQHSSEIFLQVRADPGYEGLEINEGYGLTIIDGEGNPVPNRSAGYEHLVALSLLGALQSYSPNRGPIVVDSPFGRLDSDNTKRVLGALPQIANQTLLLVYEDEFDRDAAISALGDDLIREWDLVRASSHLRTAINPR
jgi:DNA sulfur modification protein DndD